MKTKLTKRVVDRLQPRESLSDSEVRGFRVRCLPSGAVTFWFRYSLPGKARRELPLGLHGNVTVDEARDLAKQYAGKVAARQDPAAELKTAAARSENTVNAVLDEWLIDYARGDAELRSADAIEAIFERHVRKAIGDTVLYDLSRADVNSMLKKIASNAGPVMADRTRAHLNAALEWWRGRDDRFITMPVTAAMVRTSSQKRARTRVLGLDEIRDLWAALDELGSNTPPWFPSYIRLLLLLGCRRDELASMHTREIDAANDWTIPAARYKTKRDHVLPLVPAIKALLPEREKGFVFSSDGGATPFSGFSKAKRILDKTVDALRKRDGRGPMADWQLRDLRRTARSHMIAAKGANVRDDIAKRILGHVIPGIDGVYNRADYHEEKIAALKSWSAFVLGITSPAKPTNVIKLKRKVVR